MGMITFYQKSKLFRVRISEAVEVIDIRLWCQTYCIGRFYIGFDWENWAPESRNYIIEFETEQDAVLFSLRWS